MKLRTGLSPRRLRAFAGGRVALAGPRPGNFLTDLFPAGVQMVRMAFGADLAADPATWSWTDVTTYFQWDATIAVTIGYAAESATLTPASFAGTARNDQASGGDFTLGNPLGRFWPNLVENTPLWATLDLGSGPSTMFYGYLTTCQPRRAAGGENFATVQAHGITRRIGRNDAAESPMYRWNMRSYRYPTSTNLGYPSGDQGYHSLPVQLWPLEEGSGAVRGANVIDASYPLLADGATRVPQFGGDTFLPCVKAMTKFNDGTALTTNFPLSGLGGRSDPGGSLNDGSVRVQLLMRLDESTQSALKTKLGTLTDGITCRVLTLRPTVAGVDLQTVVVYLDADPTDGLLMYCDALDSRGVSLTGSPMGGDIGVQWERGVFITIDLVNRTWGGFGSQLRYSAIPLTTDPLDALPTSGAAAYDLQNFGTASVKGINTIALAEFANAAGMSLGMLSVYAGPSDSFPDRYPHALVGRSGDTVAERLYRLGVEQGVDIEIVGAADDLVMGPQSTSGFLSLIAECAAVDGGLHVDGLGPGITYITRQAMYGAAAQVTFDASNGDEIAVDEPQHTDDGRVNTYTATSGVGSTQTFQQIDGDLGSDRIGVMPDSGEHRAAFDTDLVQIAAWHVGRGTVGGLRWPRLSVQFAKRVTASKAQRFIEAMPGARVDVLGLQPGLPVPDKSLSLLGWSARWNSKTFGADLNLGLYEPFAVTTLAADSGTVDDHLGWLDTDGTTTLGTVVPGECFADEFDTGVSAWSSQNGWSVAFDATFGRLAPGSMKLTPPGAVASGSAATTALHPCTGGATYLVQGWFYSAAGWSDCRAAVDWYTAAGAFISSSLGVSIAPAAATWTVSRQTFTAPSNATQCIIRARQGGTPAVTDVLWVDDVVFMPLLQVVTPSGPVLTNDAVSTYADDIDGLYIDADGLRLRVLSITGTASPQTMVIHPDGLLRTLPTGSAITAADPVRPGL